MKIAVVGTGYVGLTLGAGLALRGHDVRCIDVVREKVDKINSGVPPIYEEGLGEALQKTAGKNLSATTSIKEGCGGADIIFIAVGTPSRDDGSIDLRYIREAASQIGKYLRETKKYTVVCVKSTVVPETTEKTVLPLLEKYSGKKCGKGFGLAMNPEFLREGTALRDFLEPDRIVIGENDVKSGDAIYALYEGFNAPVLRTKLTVAEMIKYTNNAFLAAKVSLSNEIGNICKRLNVDVYDVMKGVGLDARIGPHFLDAGCGFGGSCFPKDVKALMAKAKELGYEPTMLGEVLEVNERQKAGSVGLLEKKMEIKGKKIAILGLAFKAGTDDTRESPALAVIPALMEKGAKVVVYDPEAHVREIFPGIEHASSAQDALRGAHACLIMTDWPEFRSLGKKDFGAMENKVIIEGRRTLDASKFPDFEGVCW